MELRDEDVLCILRTLEFDGLVESFVSDDGEVYRPAKHRVPKNSPLTSIPCGVCPVRSVSTMDVFLQVSVPSLNPGLLSLSSVVFSKLLMVCSICRSSMNAQRRG